jgi:hypothetical protein
VPIIIFSLPGLQIDYHPIQPHIGNSFLKFIKPRINFGTGKHYNGSLTRLCAYTCTIIFAIFLNKEVNAKTTFAR